VLDRRPVGASDRAMIKLACWLVYPVVLPEQKFELQNPKVTVW